MGEYADYIFLMAYDQYYAGSKKAGPVSGLNWAENAVKETLAEIPAEKLVLGMPFYTRYWETMGGNVVSTKAISMETAIKLIKERMHFFVSNPIEGMKFFSVKLASTWLNPTFQTIWISYPGARYKFDENYAHYISYHAKALSMLDGKIYDVEEVLFDSFEILVFVFAGIGIFKLAKNKENVSKYTLAIIFMGGFIFHSVWETKAIYVVQYYYLLLPYTAFGIKVFIEFLKMKFEKRGVKLLADKNLN